MLNRHYLASAVFVSVCLFGCDEAPAQGPPPAPELAAAASSLEAQRVAAMDSNLRLKGLPSLAGDLQGAEDSARLLRENEELTQLWRDGTAAEQRRFLTALGLIVAHTKTDGTAEFPASAEPASPRLTDAIVHAFSALLRTGELPDAVATHAARHTEASSSLWAEAVDLTAVGVWLHPTDPAFMRALIAARSEGTYGWLSETGAADLAWPFLATERAAWERLALLDQLSPQETAWRAWAQLPGVGDELLTEGATFAVTTVRVVTAVGEGRRRQMAPAGSIFVRIEFDLTNTGTSSMSFASSALWLVDAEGRRFDMSAAPTLALMASERDAFTPVYSSINPGLRRRFIAVFEVPEGVRGGRATIEIPAQPRQRVRVRL